MAISVIRAVLLLPLCLLLAVVARAEEPAVARDPAPWGVLGQLAGTSWSDKYLNYRWRWGPDNSLLESGSGFPTATIVQGERPGTLVQYYTSRHTYDGYIGEDGSVLWIRRGVLKMPMRIRLDGDELVMEKVKLDDANRVVRVTRETRYRRVDGGAAPATAPTPVVAAVPAMQGPTGSLPPAPEARLAQATPTAPASPATVAAPEASEVKQAPVVAAAGGTAATAAAPAAPTLSDFDALLQSSFEDMCASATERKSRFCDALVALIAKRQADGIAIEIHEPAPEKPAAKKGVAGKKGAAKSVTQQELLSSHLGVMAKLIDQPRFVFRREPERDPPSSPDKGYVFAWTVPEVELEWKRITAGEEGPAIQIHRWNAKRREVIGLPLDPKAAYVHKVTVETGDVTHISTLQPNNRGSRTLLRALPDGGIQWTSQAIRDGAWTTLGTSYDVPSTPEWVARWQQRQARLREEARLAAERWQAERDAMEAQELARQQQEAEDEAEFEAERAQKAAAWNAMASASEQGLADSIARLNETAARVQAQQEQYRLQQQYAQQAAQAEQRRREAENARQATQRQYEIARQFEAQQQAQRQTQAEARAQTQTQRQAQSASAAAAGSASTLTDANTCVSRPIVGPNHACGKGTSASVTNQCPSPVDVRMCSMTPKGWDCSARWGLAPGASWSQAWCAGTSQVFMSARNSGSSTALGSP